MRKEEFLCTVPFGYSEVFKDRHYLCCPGWLPESVYETGNMKTDFFNKKSNEFNKIVKIGRTHLMDATPITLGQEFSGYVSQIDHGINALKNTLPHLSEIALGGTAVGTGINTPKGYNKLVASYIKKFTGLPFISSKNKFGIRNAEIMGKYKDNTFLKCILTRNTFFSPPGNVF
mgnify:CR=1 FL=1